MASLARALVGMSLAYLIGAPVIGFLGDWRLAFLAFAFPVALLNFFLAMRVLPSSSNRSRSSGGMGSYLGVFREIFRNRSALACLLGSILALASSQVIFVYAVAFYRQQFRVSASFASIIVIIASLIYIPGSLVAGRLVNRFGRKPLTILAALLLGLFVITFMSVPDLWLSQAFCYLGCLFAGVLSTARNSLTLEQAPRFRGTMMSLNQVAQSMGETLGIALSGAVLLSHGYVATGFSSGALEVVAVLVFLFLVDDPTRRPIPVKEVEA